ncbi:MAG TPA: hypothetical protein PKD05_05140 [Candidatus Melainabacteria bacterium]|nr:hypothetical protein [Candidatus Melainabacteria bacterium]
MRIRPLLRLLAVLSIFLGVYLSSEALAQMPTPQMPNTSLGQHRVRMGEALGSYGKKMWNWQTQSAVESAGSLGIPQSGNPQSLSIGDGTSDLLNLNYQSEPQGQKPVPESKTVETQMQWFEHYPIFPPNDNRAAPKRAVFRAYPKIDKNITMPSAEAMAARDALASTQTYGGKQGTGQRIMGAIQKAAIESITGMDPKQKFDNAKSQQHGAAQGASDAVADAFNPTWIAMLQLQMSNLLNVANEATGSPSSAFAVTKTHRNALWFVQRMYGEVYVPMAILFLLPGAVITQMKGVVSHGILSSGNDEDAASPFVGILRAMIAIFLIPACQLITSYCIDVGNSLTHEVRQNVNPITIYNWANEQVFRAPEENKVNQVMHPSNFPVLGKLTQGPEAESGVEAQSTATVMLQTLANTMAESAAMGLVMMCAFQITMICYLMLMGPLAAAFYAWPSGLGNLFNKVFSTWVDAIVNLSLWRFWWTVVLLCIDTRLGWLGAMGGYSPYSEWELLMFIAFLTILTYVPFNPFDFQAVE